MSSALLRLCVLAPLPLLRLMPPPSARPAAWLIALLLLVGGCTQRPARPAAPDSSAAPQAQNAPAIDFTQKLPPPAPEMRTPRRDSAALAGVANFAFAPEPPPVFRAEGLRLATLNTEFLFDGRGDEGQARFAWQGDPAAARAHRGRIGAILRKLDADVVMLEEVEDQQTVDLLVQESLQGLGYTSYFVQGTDRFTGQDVALLSRLPIEEIGRSDERAPVGATGDDYGVSKHLYARMNLGGQPTTLIGLHFLARPDDPARAPKREAQAEVIRRLVEREQRAGRAVAVLGDFNDFDGDVPDLAGNRPITDVLARIKRAGPGPTDDLRSVLADVPQTQRFTAHYDRNDNGAVDPGTEELSALDHILLSPSLYRAVREVHFVHAYDPPQYTDHFPIVVTLGLD